MDNKDMMPKDFHNDKMIDELAEKVLDKTNTKSSKSTLASIQYTYDYR
jgi:hypothetical protein